MPNTTRLLAPLLLAATALAASPVRAEVPDNAGPWNVRILEGGIGIERALPQGSPLLRVGVRFTLSAWVRPDRIQPGEAALIVQGEDACTPCRTLVLSDGRPALRSGEALLAAGQALSAGQWSHIAATFDGTTARIYVNGRLAGEEALPAASTVSSRIAIAPPAPGRPHFAGALAEALLDDTARDPTALFAARPDFARVQFRNVGVGWPFQRKANIGLTEQQDPWLLPRSSAPPSTPRAVPIKPQPTLAPAAPGQWQINGWKLTPAPDLGPADGAVLSRPGVDTAKWLAARVPGTVLATMVDRGVYPDPYYGLNNLRVPESLARQDYWYRTSFTVPAEAAGKSLALRFDGINYAAEVWTNGQRLGAMKGAFTRGRFTFTPVAGENVVALRVSPPPHPGIPHEQSVKGGVGENGGQLAIDGPTFVATEGWDWIPGIRDRNTGLWQGVALEATGPVRLGDPHVITDLPLPRTDSADVSIAVPVINPGTMPTALTLTARLGDVALTRTLIAAPGETTVTFSPATDPALHIANPRLWWPNGYGDPALYTLILTLNLTGAADGQPSDSRTLRFGIRELSYDLSLFDHEGRLNRVEVDPTDAKPGELPLIDVRHAAIKQTPLGWAQSLTPSGEHSPAVRPAQQTFALPHLTLRVNGVRIAARGGSWGMDDAMKRFGRAELEPYFRLEREAHMNVIRNWMGNNTEPAFYDLADENGMLILNDFWQSTQDFQIEPEDPQLFLANAADTIARYRNHPSIALWFGRNEGVPYPALNEGLDALVQRLDGTRWYTGSSNVVNLQGSGPYNYRPPEGYFTDLAAGFSVETGTPSLATREAIEASVPTADRWPLGDTMAYHDWHFSGNGDTRTFMDTLAAMFGPGTSLADFERKAQMMNLETHKAMMEGFVGHLWTKNSGRLFWMTHPSWPSNAWQLYSSDMDTSAAYYGARAGAEPVHVQLNLPNNQLTVINTTRQDRPGLTAKVRVTDLAGRTLLQKEQTFAAPANTATPAGIVDLAPLMANGQMILAALELTDAKGAVLSRNVYWRGRDTAAYRALNTMPAAPISLSAKSGPAQGADRALTLTLANAGKTPALAIKLTVLDKAGARVLPAYFEDNYISLMPGEERTLTVRVPASAKPTRISMRGWNTPEGAVKIAP